MILEIDNLTARYPDGTVAVREVSLSVPPGQRVALLGPNGSGKTSLMLAVVRALDFTGRCVVDGVELTRRTASKVRGLCGMVFQNPDDQLFMPTLLDDVAFGPLNQLLGGDLARSRAMEAIAAVGLEGLGSRPAHHLSGGQKQAAALATVLAMNVKLLLLDEPGANLDFASRRRLTTMLAGRPEAMLIATHDLGLAAEICSRAVIMSNGRIAADGPAQDILSDNALLKRHSLA